jgi:CubicO group peptidase (beta-lactamase class C family)
MTRWPAALLALLLAATTGRAEPPDPKTLDALVERARETWRVPGVAVAVVRSDAVVRLKGYGTRKAGGTDTVGPDTVFPIGSCTKGFTSAAAARLVDAGKLAWDDPVRKYLPDFRLSDPHASALVSVRDLMCHRTGLASHDLLWYRSPFTQDEQIRRAGLLPLDKPFRSDFQYQTVMWLAAGRVVEKAGGATWEKQVQSGLLDPLGMADTTFTTQAARRAGNFASPHALDEKGQPRGIPNYDLNEPNPAGSIHSTARDLACWLQFHLNDGLADGKQIVSAENLRETRSPQIALRPAGLSRREHPDTRLMSYGLGWLVQDYRGHLVVSHAGLIDGFRCHLTILPDDDWGFAILCNLDRTRMNLAVSNSLIDLALGLEPRNWNAHFAGLAEEEADRRKEADRRREADRRPEEQPTAPLSAFVGTYCHPAYGDMTVRLSEGQLVWEWGSFKVPLHHHGGDTFVGNNVFLDGPVARFAVADGTVTACEVIGVRFKRAE